MIRGLIFDVFNTLVDLQSTEMLNGSSETTMKSQQLIDTWYAKQLEYSWLLTLMNRYEPFSHIARNALIYTSRILGLNLSSEQIANIMNTRLNIGLFPDVKEGLVKLHELDHRIPLCILSNGEECYLKALISNNGIQKYFDQIISAEEAKKYKPSPEVYSLVQRRLNINLLELVLVSSNLWDVAGAKNAGMVTCWINRKSSAMEELDFKPDYVFSSITDIKNILIH
ncbi:MAG: haloacid dehalogenase type II [Nitrososphaeraceae archaeon]